MSSSGIAAANQTHQLTNRKQTEIANVDTEVEDSTIDILVQRILQNFPIGCVGNLPLVTPSCSHIVFAGLQCRSRFRCGRLKSIHSNGFVSLFHLQLYLKFSCRNFRSYDQLQAGILQVLDSDVVSQATFSQDRYPLNHTQVVL